MRALVTGGTGFIGSNLALQLHADGHEVWITGAEDEQELPELRERTLPSEFWDLDWKKLGTLDVVFHQAANNDTTFLDRAEMFRVNVEAALKLFNDAVARGCRHLVYAS
ncbi:MAG: NAD(P)-dependent oxidoreductase, partial [bacterium]|nr:NAD(P)-dependent oxidoreductase [bacterium]